MSYRKSFLIRIFAALLALVILLMGAVGIGIYTYARENVGEELIRLNQASLTQVAGNLGAAIAEIRTFGIRVSVDSRLQELLVSREPGVEKEIRPLLNDLMTDFRVSHTGATGLVELSVAGCNGTGGSVYHTQTRSWNELQRMPELRPLFQQRKSELLLPTVYRSENSGIMRYCFRYAILIRHLLTGEVIGAVILDAPEICLYNLYRDYEDNHTRMEILTEDGVVVSHKEKTMIQSQAGYDMERLGALNQKETLRNRVSDGALILSERIPGTPWVLLEEREADFALTPLAQVRQLILIAMSACVLLILVALFFSARSLLRRVLRIEGALEQVIEGDLHVRIQVRRDDEFGKIEDAFNKMVEKISALLQDVRKGEQQKRAAEMDFLHAQINSHFIHNTLTSIRFMLEMGKTREAGEMIYYFSSLLRQTLSRSGEFISLGEEMQTLDSYVCLQKYRYPNAFEAHFSVPGETETALVPRLILQPVVENAIFHGMGSNKMHIEISAAREGDRLILRVQDDGVGMPEEVERHVLQKDAHMNSIGLRNVHERIQMNYGVEFGLRIRSKVGEGTCVTAELPFLPGTGEDSVS